MASKKILTDIEVDGHVQTDELLVGTATGSVAGSTATLTTSSTSTGTNVNTWIDVARAHTATSTGGTYGAVVRVQSNSSSLDGGVIGINPTGRQSGSGGAEYVYGSMTAAEQTGSGDIDFIIADSIRAKSKGSGTDTIDYVRGISVTAQQTNATNTVNHLQGAHIDATLDSGTVGDVEVCLLDWDQTGGTITGDFAYLRLQNDTVSNITGTARAINSLSALPSEFAGSLESTSFIKTGGTSSQFLKADGSVDSNTYLTSSDVTSTQWDDITGGINYASGDVGIGVTSPAAKLDVNGAALGLNVRSTQNIGIRVRGGANNQDIAQFQNSGGSTAMVLNTNGDLGVGVTSPSARVDIEAGTVALSAKSTQSTGMKVQGGANSTDIAQFLNSAGSIKAVLNTNGYLGIGDSNPSDMLVVGGNAKASAFVLNEGNKIVFDSDADSYCSIRFDNTVGNNIYESSGQHHFKNGEDDSFETIKAGTFVKDGGTSSQFLKADGSVDSNSYITGSSLSNYVNTISTQTVGGTKTFSNSLGVGSLSPTSGISSTRVLKVSSSGNSEVNVDHTDGGTSSDIGLFSFSRNGDHLAHMKATHDGNTTSAFLSFHTQNSGGSYTNAASNERMRITSSGDIGIGKTAPGFKVDIVGGANNGLRVGESASSNSWNRLGILSYLTESQANALADHSFIYTTNPSGGTEDAFSKYGGLVIQGRDDGNSSFAIRLGQGSGHDTRMFMGATGVTTFSNTVTATNFILSSDSRLKSNVKDVDNSHIDVDWKTFEMKEHEGQKRYGVIAQELEENHPEFVRTDDKGMKSVAYVDLLIAKIAELEARLEKLEK